MGWSATDRVGKSRSIERQTRALAVLMGFADNKIKGRILQALPFNFTVNSHTYSESFTYRENLHFYDSNNWSVLLLCFQLLCVSKPLIASINNLTKGGSRCFPLD